MSDLLDDFEHPQWMGRELACRYFGLTNDDAGWDELNELVLQYKLDTKLGPNGDVIEVNANDPALKEALFERERRISGHRPDHPDKVREARMAIKKQGEDEQKRRHADRDARLARRVQQRKETPKRRIEGG